MTQEDLTINGYYTKFKSLWQEFSEYRTCSCGHQAEECVLSFLMGLNDTYASMRGQILLMDLVPSLSKVFSLLLQDEKQRKFGKKITSESSALAVKTNTPFTKGFNKGKSGRPQCTHCGLLGHVVDKCYKLHGYPPGYKSKNKGQQGGNSFVNTVAVTDVSEESVSLTRAEYQQFLTLLNTQAHFGTRTPQDSTSTTHQVATIITQPSKGLQRHEMLGTWSSPQFSKLPFHSLQYSIFSSHVNTSRITSND